MGDLASERQTISLFDQYVCFESRRESLNTVVLDSIIREEGTQRRFLSEAMAISHFLGFGGRSGLNEEDSEMDDSSD